jgi:hypothetical protein
MHEDQPLCVPGTTSNKMTCCLLTQLQMFAVNTFCMPYKALLLSRQDSVTCLFR